jgi:RNA polymerase sigma factor (sigma-70 family)
MYTDRRRLLAKGTMLNINDLHKLARDGDESAESRLFTVLTERFEQFTHRRIWDEESVKDIVQDALMAIVKEYKLIRFEKSFSAWAYKVLDNRILSYIKKKRQLEGRLVSLPDADNPYERSFTPDPELRLRLLDCLEKVHRANRRHAEILDLHRRGFKTEEIGRRLNLSANGVYITLHRARKMLEICLDTGEIE